MTRTAETGIIRATDILTITKEQYGTQISTGTIYPVLKRLEKEGNIKPLPNRRKKTYVLTVKGKKAMKFFQTNANKVQVVIDELLEIIRTEVAERSFIA